jgi:hypothetical protein
VIRKIINVCRREIVSQAVKCRLPRRPAELRADTGYTANHVCDNEFPDFENDAASIQVFMPLVLPSLLQTPACMAAQFKTGPPLSRWCRDARHEGPPGCAPGDPRFFCGPVFSRPGGPRLPGRTARNCV